ncbi:MAG: hypothetical protein WBJ94_11580 [Methanosarcina flavescens]|uniref:Uncharacterized protein n=1 Tax=Methanosarcina flavescens TaxID=1715806 RepID=A0A660HSC4_9EURY|nr:hypothetical protein [Methanosarcina flavescens]AYK15144.1 hypothetical protein AOB57_007950 [Methanosarcina flavescens]
MKSCNFIILISIFSANDFIKNKIFFVPVDLNNGIKIYRAIIPLSGKFFIAEGEDMEIVILSAGGYQVDLNLLVI